MDLFCFKCKLILNDQQKLFTHLKLVHSLRHNDVYTCGILKCTQRFKSFRSFAHMKTEINNVPIYYQLNFCNKNINVSECLNSSSNNISSVIYSNEIKNVTPEVNIDLLQDSALKLSLKYYGKLHLSRKQAIELQVDITELITKTIAMQIETKVIGSLLYRF